MEYNIQARTNFRKNVRARMGKFGGDTFPFTILIRAHAGVWEAIEMLDTLVDESDPDVSYFPVSIQSSQLMAY